MKTNPNSKKKLQLMKIHEVHVHARVWLELYMYTNNTGTPEFEPFTMYTNDSTLGTVRRRYHLTTAIQLHVHIRLKILLS